ncbi:MAG: hypothetical protein A3C38_05925 [Planctomycetes bacterium RIFCSPHIGHO2_02_FULL_50_42]|nr:MAG: hypothetical protein A3C38_05925 [Planctomycetes bacterium RIFCSPHIGHO2_02_FULL_50_42]OHC03863.1 MAG: hypothetical protein A3G17_06830 [Planctomycetes bacterium RIFCSPLOWO2_12_FULL_50_35]
MSGKVGVLIVGLNGATANTTVVGTILQREGVVSGSSFKKGMLTEDGCLARHDLVDEAQVIFGGWDVTNASAYEAAVRNRVFDGACFYPIRYKLREVKPMKAVCTSHDVNEAITSENTRNGASLLHKVQGLRQDITLFKKNNGLDEAVVVYLASPLKMRGARYYTSLEEFEKGLLNNDPGITSAMLYAYAALQEGCPFVDFTPNITLEVPALLELAESNNIPLAGRDGSTGQTLMKTLIGQMLKIRNLKLEGWYSTNILGNNDGKVLSLSEHAEVKMRDKLSVLEPLLGYSDFHHSVNIEYYRPRGDNKEAWDNIDFLGWLDQPMSMKINWLGRDSILAAPLILDLIKLLEYAHRIGEKGIQSHLAVFFKNPLGTKVRGFFDQYKLFSDYYTSLASKKEKQTDNVAVAAQAAFPKYH